ncbi:hypothetical protein K8R03_02765 [Candidatus Kaiserbacteria bacterium]|nr:hypothetical protein [Candidatus Kaiserbacteria bacterium]
MQNKLSQAFYESVIKDPLFAAEGMDLERGEVALDALRASLKEIGGYLSRPSYAKKAYLWTHPLQTHLYPVPFLKQFIECERERRRFLSQPSEAAAKRLLKSWKKAARTYRISVARFTALHHAVLSHDILIRDKKIFFDKVGNSFTHADIWQALETLKQNAVALEKDVAVRTVLLRESASEYNPPAPTQPVEGRTGDPLSEIGMTMSELNTERHAEESIIIEQHGPITVRLSNFDGQPTDRQFIVYMLQNRMTNYTFVRVEPVDRFYFLPVGTSNARYGWIGKALFQTAIDRNVPYWMQTGTRFYTMRDQQYWMDVLTIADMQRRAHLNRELVAKQRSSMLDYLLMTFVEEVGLQVQAAKARTGLGALSVYPLGAALVAHAHLSLYFLPFNGSVWRLPEKASFIGSGRVGADQSLHKGIEEVYPTVTKDMLREMIRGGMNRVNSWKERGFL